MKKIPHLIIPLLFCFSVIQIMNAAEQTREQARVSRASIWNILEILAPEDALTRDSKVANYLNSPEHGFDIKRINSMLPLASKQGLNHTVQVLINLGALVDAAHPETRYTALHIAVAYNQYEVAYTLIKNRANINALANENTTPLLLAASNGNARIVTLLLDNGADRTIKRDIYGDTPLQLVEALLTMSPDMEKELPQLLTSKIIPGRRIRPNGKLLDEVRNAFLCPNDLSLVSDKLFELR